MEAVTTAGLFALALGLVEVVKLLVEKFVSKEKDSKDPMSDLKDSQEKIALSLRDVAVSQARVYEILERMDRQIEKMHEKIDDERLERAQIHAYRQNNGKY